MRSHRQIGDEHVGTRLRQDIADIDLRDISDRHVVFEIAANSVKHGTALDDDAGLCDVRETTGVVRRGPDRVGDVAADLVGVDVEGRGELDVADVVAADIHVHEPRHGLVRFCIPVVR